MIMSTAKGTVPSVLPATNGRSGSTKLRLKWHSWLHVAIASSLVALLLLAPGFALIWRAQLNASEDLTPSGGRNTTGLSADQSILLSWAGTLAAGSTIRSIRASRQEASNNVSVSEGPKTAQAATPPDRRRLFLITLTRPRVHQAVHLTNLAHTLCVVPPPLTWIVGEPCRVSDDGDETDSYHGLTQINRVECFAISALLQIFAEHAHVHIMHHHLITARVACVCLPRPSEQHDGGTLGSPVALLLSPSLCCTDERDQCQVPQHRVHPPFVNDRGRGSTRYAGSCAESRPCVPRSHKSC